jgi:hypothetical protein
MEAEMTYLVDVPPGLFQSVDGDGITEWQPSVDVVG